MDRIVDFDANAGDRIRLDYDHDLATGDRPTRLFNAGTQRTTTLLKALGAAYADRNPQQSSHQRLRANEAFSLIGKDASSWRSTMPEPAVSPNRTG
jgi:hypothetical protein